MSLQQTYTRFLASPSAEAFASSPSLHYVTTLVTLSSTESIMKYLKREPTLIKKRVEKVLSVVEAPDRLVLEVETELEFVKNGGNYLPAMDDNFLMDQVVAFPVVHFVHFEDGLIKQIRLHWDQSNVLKQLGVIGRNGRNWPIKDGREQCKLIAASISDVPAAAPPSRSNGNDIQPTRSRGGSNSSKIDHPTRDPHASLALFTPHESDDEREATDHPKVSPRSSAKPPSRDLGEILAGKHSHDTGPLPPKARSTFTPSRTFEIGNGESAETNYPTPKKVERKVSVDSKKYEHFEFSDEPEPPVADAPTPISNRTKHGSSWAFEDFVTPEKKPIRIRKDDVRHFGWDGEGEQLDTKPVRNNKNFASRSRQNAEAHFTIKDEDTPEPQKASVAPIPDNRANISRFRIAANSRADSQATDDEDADGFFSGFGREEKWSKIHITGNGTGDKKSTGRSWAFDDPDPERKENTRASRGSRNAPKSTDQWDH